MVTTLRDIRARLAGAGVELRVAVASGAAQGVNIPIPGIKPGDVLVAVLELQPPTATTGGLIVADRAAGATVLNDAIRLTTNTTNNQLLTLWRSV